MAMCKLCRNDRTLRNSHIVPEFLYEGLYNDKGHLMAISGQGRRGWKPLQKGIREHLFCEECEQFFNEHFEKPFLAQWVRKVPLPDPWEDMEKVVWGKFDYASFKLFHLSVLYRADVSSLPMYSDVSLGRHREALRRLILDRDPGPVAKYPIHAYAVVHHQTKRLIKIVSKAQTAKLHGHRCYGMTYGGVEWWISVSSHRNREIEAAGLQCTGEMPFHAELWNEVPILQEASMALRNAL